MKMIPISFKSSELKAAHWKFLMGALGSQSLYIPQLGLIMRKLRDALLSRVSKRPLRTLACRITSRTQRCFDCGSPKSMLTTS